MNNPKAMGELNQEDANKQGGRLIVADFGAESCGDAVRLFWIVDEKTDKILDSKFKSFGCGTAIASSDAMAELCIGKTVDEAILITNTTVESFLRDDDGTPAVPPQKMHCSVMAYDVILEAASQYKGVQRSTLENADIVCECARVTKQTVIDAIHQHNITDVEDIIKITKAGSFCKSCIRPGGHEPKNIYLVDILADERAKIDKQKLEDAVNTTASGENSFDKMTIVQRIKAVDSVIDEYIRPMLVMDGGDMEIIDIKENTPYYDIYIRYLGACGSCASGSTGTLYAIEATLKQKVDENIRVLPV
jgi:NifU-like protein